MALSPTPLPSATEGSVALTDFNNAMTLLNAAFPIVAANLATDAVETLKIKDSNVTAAKLATDAVETLKIKDANVTLAKILDSCITSRKLNPTILSDLNNSATNISSTLTEIAQVTVNEPVNYQVAIFTSVYGSCAGAVFTFLTEIHLDDVLKSRTYQSMTGAGFYNHISNIWFIDDLSGSHEIELKVRYLQTDNNSVLNGNLIAIAFAT